MCKCQEINPLLVLGCHEYKMNSFIIGELHRKGKKWNSFLSFVPQRERACEESLFWPWLPYFPQLWPAPRMTHSPPFAPGTLLSTCTEDQPLKSKPLVVMETWLTSASLHCLHLLGLTHQQALHWQWELIQPITYRFLIPSVLVIQIGWFIFRIPDSLHRVILSLIVKVYFLVYFLSMKRIT